MNIELILRLLNFSIILFQIDAMQMHFGLLYDSAK